MITPSFGLTATERVLPKLALDFTTASLDGRITFTRTTDATHPATYVGSNGYITSAANNAPRFDYDPVTLACKGLLIEESRANICLRSQELNNASWSISGLLAYGSGSIVDATNSPDGTVNAEKIVENTSGGIEHRTLQSITTVAGTTYTYSIFAKAAERTRIFLLTNESGNHGTFFDLSTGSVISNSGTVIGSGIQAYANGWYRCWFTKTAVGTSNRIGVNLVNTGTNTVYTGDGVSGVYLYGGMVEAGAFATSYIPTTSAALTRNADVAVMTGTNVTDWYTPSAGTFFAETQIDGITSSGWTGLVRYGSSSDQTGFARVGASWYGYTYQGVRVESGRNYDTSSGFALGTVTKFAHSFKVGETSVASVNGDTPTVGATIGATDDTTTTFYFGRTGIEGRQYFRKLAFYTQKLTNAEVQAISKL